MKLTEKTCPVITGEELYQIIEQNDRAAFTAFYSGNFQKLVLAADKYVNDIAVAEEAVQDIFLKIWENKELLLYVKSIKSYLYKSVVNVAINHLNRQKNIEKHHLKIAADLSEEDIDLLNEQNELIVLLYREIELLPDKCQQVFKMSRIDGLKYKQIALDLGISEKTVENHMGNALRILRMRVMEQAKVENSGFRQNYFSMLSLFLY